MRILLEQVRTEDDLGLHLRSGRDGVFAVEVEPHSPPRAAAGRARGLEERGGPGEHLLVVDVEHVSAGHGGDVVAVLVCPGFAGFLRRPRSAADAGLLVPGARVSVRCVLSADAYDGLDQADLPLVTRTWHVERIDLLEGARWTSVTSTRGVGRDVDATFLLTCRAAPGA